MSVFTYIDDWFQQRSFRLRQRGPEPTLADSEVLTVEVVGAFLGLSTDKGTYEYFCRHWSHYFPKLRDIHRTTYVRQSANPWHAKMVLWRALLKQVNFDPAFSIVDSVPVPVCRFARATFCRRLRDCSAYGHDEVVRQKFFGVPSGNLIDKAKDTNSCCLPGCLKLLDLTLCRLNFFRSLITFVARVRAPLRITGRDCQVNQRFSSLSAMAVPHTGRDINPVASEDLDVWTLLKLDKSFPFNRDQDLFTGMTMLLGISAIAELDMYHPHEWRGMHYRQVFYSSIGTHL